jgi:hypothetical protein
MFVIIYYEHFYADTIFLTIQHSFSEGKNKNTEECDMCDNKYPIDVDPITANGEF